MRPQSLCDLIEDHQIPPLAGAILGNGLLELSAIEPDASATGADIDVDLTQLALQQSDLEATRAAPLLTAGQQVQLVAAVLKALNQRRRLHKTLQLFAVEPNPKAFGTAIDLEAVLAETEHGYLLAARTQPGLQGGG